MLVINFKTMQKYAKLIVNLYIGLNFIYSFAGEGTYLWNTNYLCVCYFVYYSLKNCVEWVIVFKKKQHIFKIKVMNKQS